MSVNGYLHDYAYDGAGNPIAATITAYIADTTTVVGAGAVASSADGSWTINDVPLTQRYDVKQQYGSSVTWIKGKSALPPGPLAHLTAPGTQSFASGGSETPVTWNTTPDYDNDALFAAGTPTKLTIVTPGIYRANAWTTWGANTVGVRTLTIVKNFGLGGSLGFAANATNALSAGGINTSVAASGDYFFAAGDTITVTAFQSSGGNLTLVGGMLSVARIG